MSFKAEVKTGSDPKWYDNAIRLATEEEAENYARRLSGNWLLVVDYRVVQSPDPINYEFKGGNLKSLS